MDHFKKDKDLFLTSEGRAKNRLPNELPQPDGAIVPSEALKKVGRQQGTILSAEMVNDVVDELVNAIQGMGEIPERGKANQLSSILMNWFVYQNIGKINSWVCPKINIPKSEAVLDGSILNPEDYEDNLKALLKVFPSWASGGKVILPNYDNYFQRFQSSRTPGNTQGHTIQPLTVGNPTFTADDITIPGRVVRKDYYFNQNYEGSGREITSMPIRVTGATGYNTQYIAQEDATKHEITISVSGDTSLKGAVTDSANETRPKNFAVLMSVVVGIPKSVPA